MPVLYCWLFSIAFADPQEIPEETDSSDTEQPDTDNSEQPDTDNSEQPDTDNSEQPENQPDNEVSTEEEETTTLQQNEEKDTENPSTHIIDTDETEKTIREEEISLPELSDLPTDFSILNDDDDEEKEDIDISFLEGSFQWAINFHYWKMLDDYQYLSSVVFEGDPQYKFKEDNFISPLLGIRFRASTAETIQYKMTDNLLGIITGIQIGPVRVNTSGSYYNHLMFHQQEKARNNTIHELVYSYQELPISKGIFWEQAINLRLKEPDLVIETSIGFPFQIQGTRELGEAFTDSYRWTTAVSISGWLLEYEYNIFPNSEEHILSIGNNLEF